MKIITSDGAEFETMAAARKHEKALKAEAKQLEMTDGLLNFLTAKADWLTPEDVEAIVDAVMANTDAFREAVAPLLRKPRKPRSDAGQPRKKGKKVAAVAA